MRINKNNLLILSCISILSLSACKNDGAKQGTTAAGSESSSLQNQNSTSSLSVSGNIVGSENLNVIVDKVELTNKIEMLGSQKADGAGNFKIKLATDNQPALYRLRIGSVQYYFPLMGNEKDITFNGTLQDIANFNLKVTGAPDAVAVNEQLKLAKTGSLTETQVLDFINKSANPVANIWLAMNAVVPSKNSLATFKKVGELGNSSHANNIYVKDFNNYLAQLNNEVNQPVIEVGHPAPDLDFAGPDGKNYKLSELKGKTVLLDFWASWCGPCRRENPAVVQVYDKYKSKGFTVFSVSLDKEKERWLEAIKNDNLKWQYHVSDLQGWSSMPANMYGVRSIPATFLIDKNGNIAAKGLRGAASIEENLKKIL